MRRFILLTWAVITSIALNVTATAAIMEEADPELFGESEQPSTQMALPQLNATNVYGDLLGVAKSDQDLADKIAQARKVVMENPTVPRHYRMLGELLTRANRLDEAAEAYWKSARIDPLNAAPLHYLGFTLLALGDHENGYKIYKQLEARYADARKVLFNLGAAHYGMQEYERAASYYDNYIKTARREDPRVFYNYGITLLASGNAADAVAWLDKSAARLSNSPFVIAALIRAHTELGNDEKRELIEQIAEQKFGLLRIKPILNAETLPVFLDR